ncbi:hypothetical protein JTE90_018873 [Oedothorax gibbosus]|uniref:Uncharacterized protein n=1 Tax=Oedothorax gibbosus TaxID=931172 RepID=A0AAV6TVW3_9ARAC|nr:hypothetical protein JTE90_018873 [Oedothorax gibbosus]
MFNCCSHGTLLQLQSSRFSLEYLLLPPRSALVAAPGGLTPGTFNARHRDPPTHCGVNLHEGSSAVAARYRPNAGASSIFRASCFGRELQNHFSKDSSPTGNFIVEKLDNLRTFFDTHVQYPLSMTMRNVLVGEFIGPLLDYVQNQGRKSLFSNVDNLVEIKRNDIEINKLKESLTSAQNKIDKLEEELGKEREASRTFLENGVNLSRAREEIDKQSYKKVVAIKNSFQSHLEELDRLEKDRQKNCEIIIDKLIKGRTDELDSTKLILEQYDARCNENKDMINKVSGEMENLRESVTSALEAFKSDIGEAKVTTAQAPPSFADVVATGSSKENVTIFVDLPVEGGGVKDFRGFKNALGAILSKESCKCSGIYETKKGAK